MKKSKETVSNLADVVIINTPEQVTSKVEDGNLPEELQEKIVITTTPIKSEIIDQIRLLVTDLEPNAEHLDCDELLSRALEFFVAQNKKCEKLSDENRRIAETIIQNPRLYVLIENLLKGEPASVALVKSDLINVMPENDTDDDYEAYCLAVAQTRKRNQQAKKEATERMTRCNECSTLSKQFYKEIDASDDEVNDFILFIEKVIDNIFNATIDQDFLSTMWRAYNFNNEIKKAHEMGVVDGKNEIINIRRRSMGDGLPSQSVAGSKMNSQPRMGYIERLLNNQR